MYCPMMPRQKSCRPPMKIITQIVEAHPSTGSSKISLRSTITIMNQEGNTSHAGSKPGSNGQWSLGEINDSADGIFKQLPEIPLGFTGNTFDVFVGKPEGFETDPSEDSLGETVVFAHRDDSVYHTAFHQTEISGSVYDIRIGNSVNQLVKFPGKKAADGRLPITADTSGGNTVIFSGFQFLKHFRKKGRRS